MFLQTAKKKFMENYEQCYDLGLMNPYRTTQPLCGTDLRTTELPDCLWDSIKCVFLTLYLLDYALSYPEACYCSLFPCLGMPSNYLNKCWNNAFFWRFYKSIDDVTFFFMSVSSNIWFLGCCWIWGAKTEMYFEQLYYLRSAVLTDMYRNKDLKWLHWIGLLFDTKVSIKLMMGICNIYFG